jgi:hypothetical protein
MKKRTKIGLQALPGLALPRNGRSRQKSPWSGPAGSPRMQGPDGLRLWRQRPEEFLR